MERAVHTFTVPKRLVRDGLATRVGLRELTAEEELAAMRRGQGDMMRSTYEAVKAAVCTLDGKPLDRSSGELDRYWETCGQKVRSLLMQAYGRLSAAEEDEARDFFSSEEVSA